MQHLGSGLPVRSRIWRIYHEDGLVFCPQSYSPSRLYQRLITAAIGFGQPLHRHPEMVPVNLHIAGWCGCPGVEPGS